MHNVDPLVLHRSVKGPASGTKKREPLIFDRKGKFKAPNSMKNNTGSGIAYLSNSSAVAFVRQTVQYKYKFTIRHVQKIPSDSLV